MRYYSDITKRTYDTEAECLKAEKIFNETARKKEEAERKKSEERKNRAQQIEAAREEVAKAKEKYDKLLTDFCRDYGSYHYSITSPMSLSEYFSTLLNF